MENIASTRYNDLTGTIALDESNFCSFKDFCKIICELKIPQGQKPIGIDMQISNEHGSDAGFYLYVICRDTKNNYFRYAVEDVKGVDILNLFKRVHIVMFKRFEADFDIKDLEPIYKE